MTVFSGTSFSVSKEQTPHRRSPPSLLLPCGSSKGMASPATSITVAKTIWEQIESSRSVSDDHLSILLFLFGKNLERATRIVDQGGVRKVSAAPSGRSLFLVVGESRRTEEYICFPEHHCTCYSFFYDVVNRGEQLCCKHQIAARLAEATGQVEEVEVSDEQLAMMLSKL